MRWAASDVSPSSHLAFHIPTLAGFCLLFVLCSCLVLLLWCVFCFLFCECLGIPNSPRSLDLDDRQGLIARSAMQQKKKRGKLVHGSFKKVTYETLLSSQLQSRLTHPMICCLQPMRSYWAHTKQARLFSSCVKNLGAVSLNLEDLLAGMRGNVLPK